MPSPFPGMNPYLEQSAYWQDFHNEFLSSFRRTLWPKIAPNYIVQGQEHIYIHDIPSQSRRRVGNADVSVVGAGGRLSTGVGVLEAPAEVWLPDVEEERVRYLEIRDRLGQELVTIIELLSPTNKRAGADRDAYLAKRWEVLGSPAHLVEIDLLRGWTPMPLADRPECDYSVLISRAERRPAADFWPIRLREPLPIIPIPLRAEDGAVSVDLQEVLHRTYDEAGFATFIYKGTPQPALSADDGAWVHPFVPSPV